MRLPRGSLGKHAKRVGAAAGLTVVLVYALFGLVHHSPASETTLSRVTTEITSGHVRSATVDDLSNTVTLTLNGGRELFSRYPMAYANTLTKSLLAHHVAITTTDGSGLSGIINSVLGFAPALVLIGFLLWFSKKGGITSGIGRLQGKRGSALGTVPTTTFADVAGCPEAVQQLRELVEYLKDPLPYQRLGATLPRGALLVGPPGTGKTLLARAVAGEAGVPFFPMAGSDFVETFVGMGAKRVRELFDRARATGKAIIFIDELDAAGRSRNTIMNPGDSERDNTLVSLLNEMDGFDRTGVIVLAATNRPDTLDPALTRPGRLDRRIEVPTPDRHGRQEILGVHMRGKPLAPDVEVEALARQTPGMSGAELAQLVNEGAMEATRAGATAISQRHFSVALHTVTMGRARTSAYVTERDREITAWHEAGHATLALLLENVDDPAAVTLIPRGQAGGFTQVMGNDDIFLSRPQALERLQMMLGGRAAEMIHLGEEGFTTGAEGDLVLATRLATAMVTQYGMVSTDSTRLLVHIAPDELRLGAEVSTAVNMRVNELLNAALEGALAHLRTSLGSHLLDSIHLRLLEEETLYAAELTTLLTNSRGSRLAAVEMLPREGR